MKAQVDSVPRVSWLLGPLVEDDSGGASCDLEGGVRQVHPDDEVKYKAFPVTVYIVTRSADASSSTDARGPERRSVWSPVASRVSLGSRVARRPRRSSRISIL